VIAQTRQDPALRDLDGNLNLRLVLWAFGRLGLAARMAVP